MRFFAFACLWGGTNLQAGVAVQRELFYAFHRGKAELVDLYMFGWCFLFTVLSAILLCSCKYPGWLEGVARSCSLVGDRPRWSSADVSAFLYHSGGGRIWA